MQNKVQVQVLGEFFFSQIQKIPIFDHEGRRWGIAGSGHPLGPGKPPGHRP